MVPFHELLREERTRLGLSQTAFGEVGGVTKKTQMLYESGERYPDAEYLTRVARLGVDVQYVLLGSRAPVGGSDARIRLRLDVDSLVSEDYITADEGRLLAAFRSAPDKQATILEVVEALAMETAKTKRAKPRSSGGVVIHGDVGQSIEGGQSVTAPLTFNVGGKKK